MSTLTVPHSPNGTKPPVPLRIVPALGQKIDDLHELRSLIRQSQEAERRLTAEVLAGLEAAGLTWLAGQRAIASVDHRTTLRPDVGLFLDTTGPAGHAALSVSVTAARRHNGHASAPPAFVSDPDHRARLRASRAARRKPR